MALLRDRASGIMDYIGGAIQEFANPAQAVVNPMTDPRTLMTSQPRSAPLVTAQPSPMMPTAMSQPPRVTPAQVAPSAQPQANASTNRLIGGQQAALGQGRMQEGMDREKMMRDAKIAKDVLESGDESLIERAKGYFGNRENMVRLALAFNSMRTRPDAGLASVLGDELKDIRTQTRAQSTRNATANWLRSQNREDLANLVEQGMIDGKKATELFMGQTGRVVTSAQLKQQYPGIEIEDGLYNIKADGTMNKVGGGGVSVQVDSGGAPGLGKLSTDYTYARDPDTNEIVYRNGMPIAVPVPGSPAARELEQQEQKTVGRQEQTARAGATVIQDLQRALDLVPELGAISSGEGVVGGVSRTALVKIPGTVENRITQFTESALSNVGLDTLQQMRENSPTGGALGQVPIQQQQRLEQVLGSLQINQPPEVLSANIKRVMNIYTDIIYGTARERAEAVQAGKMTQEESNQIDSFYYDLPFDERGRIVDAPRVIEYDSQGRRLN